MTTLRAILIDPASHLLSGLSILILFVAVLMLTAGLLLRGDHRPPVPTDDERAPPTGSDLDRKRGARR